MRAFTGKEGSIKINKNLYIPTLPPKSPRSGGLFSYVHSSKKQELFATGFTAGVYFHKFFVAIVRIEHIKNYYYGWMDGWIDG